MKKVIRRTSIILFLYVMLFTVTMPIIATTVNDLNNKLDQAEAAKVKADQELNASKIEYDDLIVEMNNIEKELATTKSEIVKINADIIKKENEIKDLEHQIEEKQIEANKMRDQSASSLLTLQNIQNKNLMVESIFGGENANIGEIYKRSEGIQMLTDNITSVFDDLITVLNEIKDLKDTAVTEKQNLEDSKVQLAEKQVDLEKQNIKLAAYETSLQNQIAKQEHHANDLKATQESLDSQKKAFEDAGCKGNDVYGVDCGVGEIINTGSLRRPVASGTVTSEFGGRWGKSHKGIDLGNSRGTPIYAAASGKVVSVNNSCPTTGYYGSSCGGGFGNNVTVIHVINGVNYLTTYPHLSSVNVSYGQIVNANTKIGGMGMSGSSTGVHLHFQLNKGTTYNGEAVNPRTFINFPGIGVWFNGR